MSVKTAAVLAAIVQAQHTRKLWHPKLEEEEEEEEEEGEGSVGCMRYCFVRA
jgi:hypothetical protein